MPSRPLSPTVVVVAGLLAALWWVPPPVATQPPAPTRVLFIGNSFMAYNDLHELVGAVAEHLDPPVSIDTNAIVPGGVMLKHHWEGEESVAQIRSGEWDIVVLQGQSMLGNALVLGSPTISQPERSFWPSVRLLDAAAASAGSQVLLLQTPGQRGVPRNAEALTHAYMTIREELAHPVAPVGLAWQRVHVAEPTLQLWAPDGSHPSPLGSRLAVRAHRGRHRDPQQATVVGQIPLPAGAEQEVSKLAKVRVGREGTSTVGRVVAQDEVDGVLHSSFRIPRGEIEILDDGVLRIGRVELAEGASLDPFVGRDAGVGRLLRRPLVDDHPDDPSLGRRDGQGHPEQDSRESGGTGAPHRQSSVSTQRKFSAASVLPVPV